MEQSARIIAPTLKIRLIAIKAVGIVNYLLEVIDAPLAMARAVGLDLPDANQSNPASAYRTMPVAAPPLSVESIPGVW